MAWEEFRASMRRLVRSKKTPRSTVGAVGSMARLSVLGGIAVAAILIPATTFVAVTGSRVTHDLVALPLTLEDRPNPQTTRLLASNGELLAYFYQENRQDVPLDKIAPVMQKAILAIEDSRFYEHGALDLKGTLRALVNNASDGQTQGGSTITQQLVKLTLLSQATSKKERIAATETSLARKARELKLAIAYEEEHTKKEILERYLNIAYFGDGAYGIQAAAYHYFSKSPDKLTSTQAATLAGLVKNPVEFDPRVYPERALQRRNTVLAVMGRLGLLSTSQVEKRSASPLDLKITKYPNGCVTSVAAFSCDYVQRYLFNEPALGADLNERKRTLERGGLTIHTNIDLRMQKAANEAVNSTVGAKDRAVAGIAMVEPGTGKVRGIAQSRPMGTNKKKGQTFLNYLVPTGLGGAYGFPAGSTFKLFTAAAALQQGIDVGKVYKSPNSMTIPAGTYFDCEGGGTDAWRVSNSTGSGSMNMYTGFRRSVNTYFAQLERDAGLCNTVKMAEAMGITVPFDPDNKDSKGRSRPITNQVPSFTLGITDVSPLDMAAAYATPASGGKYCKPMPVAKIVDFNDEIIKEYEPTCERVLSKDDAAQINDILRGLQQPGGFGFSNGTGLDIMSAAKTGTIQNNKAVWYNGYTPELSTAAMIAGLNKKGQPKSLVGTTIKGQPISFAAVGGSSLAGPMWKKAMGVIQDYLEPSTFDPPPKGQPKEPEEDDDDAEAGDGDDGADDGGGGDDDARGNRGGRPPPRP